MPRRSLLGFRVTSMLMLAALWLAVASMSSAHAATTVDCFDISMWEYDDTGSLSRPPGARAPTPVRSELPAMPCPGVSFASSLDPLVPRAATGAESAFQGAQLRTHLRLQAEYGQAGVRELANGRFRYYGELTPPRTPGTMVGRRLVREWDPATGAQRTWFETLDASGNVRIVRPESGGPKVHHVFDAEGNYIEQF